MFLKKLKILLFLYFYFISKLVLRTIFLKNIFNSDIINYI